MDAVRRGWFFLLVCVSGFLFLAEEPRAGRLSLQAGLGYEFLSQRYFADSATLEGPDSTLAAWSLTSTYLDDINGRFSARWQPLASSGALELGATLEQTPDFLRLKTTGAWRYRHGGTSLDTDTEVEWREKFGSVASFGDSYLSSYSRARGAVPLGNSLKTIGRLYLETVDFHSSGAFALDYLRFGGSLGIERTFADFSWAEVSVLYSQRTTPDSASLDYTAAGVEASFLGFLPTGSLDLSARLESRDYRRPDQQDDQWRAELLVRNRLGLGEQWFGLQGIDLEQIWYSAEDWLRSDYLRLGGNLQLGAEVGNLTVAAGPDMEVLTRTGEPADSLAYVAEDYWEAGGKLDIDFLGDGSLFVSAESTTGYRTLEDETKLQTSFLYERVYVMADIRLLTVLNLSTLFSAEWEWHSEASNNGQLYLLSTALTYTF